MKARIVGGMGSEQMARNRQTDNDQGREHRAGKEKWSLHFGRLLLDRQVRVDRLEAHFI